MSHATADDLRDGAAALRSAHPDWVVEIEQGEVIRACVRGRLATGLRFALYETSAVWSLVRLEPELAHWYPEPDRPAAPAAGTG